MGRLDSGRAQGCDVGLDAVRPTPGIGVRLRAGAGGELIRGLAGLAAAILLALAVAVPQALAETRFALVIGNSAYARAPLANPRNDAQAIAASLATAGFSVATLTDADIGAMREAILAFGRRLRGSDSVGVFYYAGHGVQVDGENYLIPIGADITDASEIPLLGLSLGELLKTMERAESRLNIAILDACRDNPYPAATRSAARGLAPVKAPAGTLIAFATGPGQVALDGSGPNSPYSGALAAAMVEVGIPLEETFRRTRRAVLEATAKKQVPWEHSSLTGEFFFRPKMAEPEARALNGVAPAASVDAANVAELADWQRIKDSKDTTALRAHIERYPAGVFRELAALKIERLEQAVSPWSWIVTGSTANVTARSDQIDAYEQALKIESRAADKAQYAEAAALYRKAAERGLPQAIHRLAHLYDQGLGVDRDKAEAARLYRQAADLGHPASMAALGTLTEFGEGTKQDTAEAVRLYRQAAEAGEPSAMTSLGFLYASGKGVARDAQMARRWYRTAADRGEKRAMFNLALMNIRGEGNRPDLAEAVRLLEGAAEQGHAGAHRELAFLYDEGRGVARSPERAASHLLAAVAAGHDDAERDVLQRPGAWSFATRRALQRQLADRGLYRGGVHGIFNTSTKAALRKLATGS